MKKKSWWIYTSYVEYYFLYGKMRKIKNKKKVQFVFQQNDDKYNTGGISDLRL